MDVLLSEGFDFTHADSLCEYTFMEQSCLLGKIDFVKWFIENSINIRRYRYEFCYAAEKNNIELVKLLLNNEYSASDVDESGRNGLHYAAQENNIDMCRLLIECNCAVNQLDESGQSPLYIAAGENNIEIAKMLLLRHAKVDICGIGDGTTPFMIACAFGTYDICDFLISFDSDIDMQDSDGRTALIFSAIKSDAKCIEYLLSHGADTSITDKDNIGFYDIQSNSDLREKLYYEEFIAD